MSAKIMVIFQIAKSFSDILHSLRAELGVTGFSVSVKKTINFGSKIFLILYIYLYIYNIRYNSGQGNDRKSNCNTATAKQQRNGKN